MQKNYRNITLDTLIIIFLTEWTIWQTLGGTIKHFGTNDSFFHWKNNFAKKLTLFYLTFQDVHKKKDKIKMSFLVVKLESISG